MSLKGLACSLGAITGFASYYYVKNSDKVVFNSWTSYIPSPHGKWDTNWDRREPFALINPKKIENVLDENEYNEKLEAVTPKAFRHIILIRHGQYNLGGSTDEERILTDKGRKQAEFTAKRLHELAIPFTEMVKSTMTRAQETGDIIAKSLPEKLPIVSCDYLREGAPVPPEPPFQKWKKEYHQFYQDGSRIEAAFRKYFHRAPADQTSDSYHLLVCHANVIRYFVCRALQFPAEGWLRMSLNHASITWITITPSGKVILKTLGESGHLPPNMLSVQ